ncbi:MAG TPA: alcohol dehydrogenase catalytic domain-containing protein, partial [Sphaerochaeta sp.]|nr:alcohol dehydrogenase catalytic domain-containing protein [Sphaerochaeta sp.]
MQSIQIKAPKSVVLVDQERPIPNEGEVLLRLLYGGICGSDLSSYRGTFAYVTYPRIPGHEFSAEVIAINGDAPHLKEGMLVTANPYFNCGTCYACQNGLVNACMDNQTMGVQREGGFSEYITLPIERVYDGKGLDAKTLALIEPFAISYHGVKRAAPRAGERVLIIGAGTIGIFAAHAASLFGAKVWLADIAEGKLELAKSLGFPQSILNKNEEYFAEQVAKVTDGAGFDVVVEAVGLGATFLQSVEAACHGGRVVQIGVGTQ